jgi:UDP-N-acetylmuramyl pentapeptide phosphotransferase/UDP-N-acetylglucosamine-1-phosphate transferase
VVAVLACAVALISIPFIIKWAHNSGTLTPTNHRTSHTAPVPSLGGVGIFLGILAVIPFLYPSLAIWAIMVASLLLLAAGLIDDVREISPKAKLLVQIFCATLVYLAGIKIDNLQGLLGIYEISEYVGFGLTLVFIVGVINSFNLIDGIDGLAGSIGTINATIFGVLFYLNDQPNFALLAFAIAGALVGFLRYNIKNARIFMGDTGSLFLGLMMSVFTIYSFQTTTESQLSVSLAFVPMFIPIFDTLRLFITRMIDKKSPMEADKNHLHHLVLKSTLNHTQATIYISLFHAVLIGAVLWEASYGRNVLLSTVLVFLLLAVVLFFAVFIGIEVYSNVKRLKAHKKLLTSNNKLLEKL